jgi:hypothetical protein
LVAPGVTPTSPVSAEATLTSSTSSTRKVTVLESTDWGSPPGPEKVAVAVLAILVPAGSPGRLGGRERGGSQRGEQRDLHCSAWGLSALFTL